MKKTKTPKVEELATVSQTTNPTGKAPVPESVSTSSADNPAFERAVEKVFSERQDLLRKLAH